MNRLKKEIMKKGIKLEHQYDFMPYNGLETVVVDSEKAIVKEYHNCFGWSYGIMNRNGSIDWK